MKAIVQRVNYAQMIIDDKEYSEIGVGFMVLLGVADGDTDKDMEVLCDKVAKLRIFTDENDKMNLSLSQVAERGTETAVMVVSNFTLCGNCSHGNRPEFFGAAAPDEANRLYEAFVERMRTVHNLRVETGVFGAHMHVRIENNGPVTLIIDSADLKKK